MTERRFLAASLLFILVSLPAAFRAEAKNWFLASYTISEPTPKFNESTRFHPIGNGRHVLFVDGRTLLYSAENDGIAYQITDGLTHYGAVDNTKPLRPNVNENSENPKLLTPESDAFYVSAFEFGIDGLGQDYILIWDENTLEISALMTIAPHWMMKLSGVWDFANPVEMQYFGDYLSATETFSGGDRGFVITSQRDWDMSQGWWPGWNTYNHWGFVNGVVNNDLNPDKYALGDDIAMTAPARHCLKLPIPVVCFPDDYVYITGTMTTCGTENSEWESVKMSRVPGSNIFYWSGLVTAGDFGIEAKGKASGTQTKWIHGQITLSEPGEYSFKPGQTNSKSTLEGLYTLVYDAEKETLTVSGDPMEIKYAIHGSIITGTEGWKSEFLTDADGDGIYTWTGRIYPGDFGFKNVANGAQVGWFAPSGWESWTGGNAHSDLDGYYTIRLDSETKTVTFVEEEDYPNVGENVDDVPPAVGEAEDFRVLIHTLFDDIRPTAMMQVRNISGMEFEPLHVNASDGRTTVADNKGIYTFEAVTADDSTLTFGAGTHSAEVTDLYKTVEIADDDFFNASLRLPEPGRRYSIAIDMSKPGLPLVTVSPVAQPFTQTLYLVYRDADGNWVNVGAAADPTAGNYTSSTLTVGVTAPASGWYLATSATPGADTRFFSAETGALETGVATALVEVDPDATQGMQIPALPAKITVDGDLSDGIALRVMLTDSEPVIGDKLYIHWNQWRDLEQEWVMVEKNGTMRYDHRRRSECWYMNNEMTPVEGRPGVFTTVIPMTRMAEGNGAFLITATPADSVAQASTQCLRYDPEALGWSSGISHVIEQKGARVSFSNPEQCGTFWNDYASDNYRITVDASDAENVMLYIEHEDVWYFYGDLNWWSIVGNNAGDPQTIVNIDSTVDKTAETFLKGERYMTIEELDRDWRFTPCEAPDGAPEDARDGWWMLDLSDKTDSDGNPGRLCGQFKIVSGFWDAADFGPSTESQGGPEYFNHGLSAGQLYEATYYSNSFNGNFYMNNAYVEGAKIYFRRSREHDVPRGDLGQYEGKGYVLIDAPEDAVHDIYTYYIGPTGTSADPAPSATSFNDLSQYIYYSEKDQYVASTGKYEWEYVAPAIINGREYPDGAWRKLIPSGAAHRYPIEFNVSVAKTDGTFFPAVRIECRDILFSEQVVNVYFRYENGYEPEDVTFNVRRTPIDDEGFLLPDEYLSGNRSQFISMTPGHIEREPSGRCVRWFACPTPLPIDFAQQNCFVAFATADGGEFPDALFDAADLSAMEMHGHDFYYVVPAEGEVHLLYSHLPGTYHLGQTDAQLQIQAEFIEEDGSLRTSYDAVGYTWQIAAPDGTVTETATTCPFLDYTPSIPGDYTVMVGTEADGRYAASVDIYRVYPAEFTPGNTPAASDYLSDFTCHSHPTITDYGNTKALSVKHYLDDTETDHLDGHDVEYQWVKFEDTAHYTALQHHLSDNPSDPTDDPDRLNPIDQNHTKKHNCCNFSNAYYRIYALHRPAAQASVKAAGFTSVQRPVADTRVARTIAVNDNTNGVAATPADDAEATAVYYNLQGMRIAAPLPGQTVIEVRGNRAEKKIFR